MLSKHNNISQVSSASKIGLDTKNIALLALLALQIGIGVFLLWPTSATVADTGQLLAIDNKDAIVDLEITDATGNQIAFVRTADGWILTQADEYPADATKIDSIVEKVLAINRLRLVTETETSHDRLQVSPESFASRLILRTADDEDTLFIGSSAGPGSTHVRLADDARTYLTADVASWEFPTQVASWIDTSYVAVEAGAINALTIENATQLLTFSKDADGAWTLDDLGAEEIADTAAIESLLDRIRTVALLRPLDMQIDPSYGLDPPAATATVVHQDESGAEVTTIVQVGASLENDAGYYAKSSDSAYYVTIGATTGDAIVNATRAEFVTQETAADADSGGGGSEDTFTPDEIQIEPAQPITP